MAKTSKRGGARKGAGRKATGRIRVGVWIKPDKWKKIVKAKKTLSKDRGRFVGPGEVIEESNAGEGDDK